MRTGPCWYQKRFVDCSRRHPWRAEVLKLRICRDSWTDMVTVDFTYRVEFWDDTKGRWLVRSENFQ